MEGLTVFNFIGPSDVTAAYDSLTRAVEQWRSLQAQGAAEHLLVDAGTRIELAQLEVDRVRSLIDMFQTRTYETDGKTE